MTTQLRELEADIRNKLALPLIVLDMLRDGEAVREDKIDLAVRELRAIVKMFGSTSILES